MTSCSSVLQEEKLSHTCKKRTGTSEMNKRGQDMYISIAYSSGMKEVSHSRMYLHELMIPKERGDGRGSRIEDRFLSGFFVLTKTFERMLQSKNYNQSKWVELINIYMCVCECVCVCVCCRRSRGPKSYRSSDKIDDWAHTSLVFVNSSHTIAILINHPSLFAASHSYPNDAGDACLA